METLENIKWSIDMNTQNPIPVNRSPLYSRILLFSTTRIENNGFNQIRFHTSFVKAKIIEFELETISGN